MRGLKTTLFSLAESRHWVPIFFVFIFGIGLSTYKDYGISWDERVERLDGAVALRYIENQSFIQFPGLELMLQKQEYPASLELHHYKDRYCLSRQLYDILVLKASKKLIIFAI